VATNLVRPGEDEPMSIQMERPDVAKILRSLKDFQLDTVEYVFHRLYLDNDCTRRFLIADEAGLGKTLVARGLIAKAVNFLWETVDRIDVVYICSNSDIARQNINRLNVTSQADCALPSRITLLPIKIRDLKENKLNFVALTPTTSFDLGSSLGRADERALLYWLLHRAWDLKGTPPLNILQGDAGWKGFRDLVYSFNHNHEIDDSLAEGFAKALQRKEGLRARFDKLCHSFARARKDVKDIPEEDARERRRFVADLRSLLAVTCIRSLEPDLIILDEFQRFKGLLDPDDATGHLAQELFDYSSSTRKARVLLLSATPYKMYTMTDEAEEEDHYSDFLGTLRFLHANKMETDRFESLLSDYRHELLRWGGDGQGRLKEITQELESRLRRVMVRTEKLAVSEDREGMLTEVRNQNSNLEMSDLESYVGLQGIARALEQGDTLEYWKSAPYLLNFMDNYELKKEFLEALDDPGRAGELTKLVAKSAGLMLRWSDIAAYDAVDPRNARLRGLLADTIGAGVARLLWLPPSLPYYRLGGPFGGPELTKFTKRLVFSSWRVVPKVVACLLSYEAERAMFRSFESSPENSPEARKGRRPLLRFARTDGRLSGMPVLGLIYPSVSLARLGDPLRFAAMVQNQDSVPTSIDVLRRVEQDINVALSAIMPSYQASSPEDEAWYWAAPILLDLHDDGDVTRDWFSLEDRARIWAGKEESQEEDEEESLWAAHVRRAKDLVSDPTGLGPPPKDLSQVLAQMALAGLGVAALRALARMTDGAAGLSTSEMRNSAARISWSFLSLFNQPEAMALLRGLNKEEPYWRRVLEYCIDGGLQSTLDEYVHILRESLGLIDKSSLQVVQEISEAICGVLTVRTSTLLVDGLALDPTGQIVEREERRMRSRFASRFGDERQEDGEETTRADQVRNAFNSPFWPFVLVSTSVGQEGLDFHQYCHAVVHWNLPSNPVDLEQREGRVHRYKGHAVRKNLAKHYGPSLLISGSVKDPWEALFDAGKHDRAGGSSDLVPFWVYSVEGGAKIERHVPALPLSRDLERFDGLRRSLAVYRMVFGQTRQEDLLAFLLARIPQEEVDRVMRELRINLAPPPYQTADKP